MRTNNEGHKYMIIKDRVELYRDFSYNLLSYIYDFYLDKQTLGLDQDIKNHFMFCYNKVCTEFLLEELDFTQNKELIEYFFTYYYHHFYRAEKDVQQTFFVKFWNTIFDVEKPKNKNADLINMHLLNFFKGVLKTGGDHVGSPLRVEK